MFYVGSTMDFDKWHLIIFRSQGTVFMIDVLLFLDNLENRLTK